MRSEKFIRRLKSAKKKDLSYTIKDLNLTEIIPSPLEVQKNLSCSFVATYEFGSTKIALSQGVSVNYTSMDEASFLRSELHRVDYLDKVILEGFDDFENGQFDLAFLLEQLSNQNSGNLKQIFESVQSMIDFIFNFASIEIDSVSNKLLNAFDDYILAMPEVKKLVTSESDIKLTDILNSIKMSDFETKLEQAVHNVGNIEVVTGNNLYQFLSSYITSTFTVDEIGFEVGYYMQRKYPIHNPEAKVLGINDTTRNHCKKMYIDSKMGDLSLDLTNRITSVEQLLGNTSLFFRLQSLFELIKRQNQDESIVNKFDDFYFNTSGLGRSKKKESLLAPRLDHMFWRRYKH